MAPKDPKPPLIAYEAPSPYAKLTDAEIVSKLDELEKRWKAARDFKDDEGMAGSPGEGIWEEMGALEHEQKRRRRKRK